MTNGGYDILVGVDSSDECIGWVSAMKIMVNDQESSSAGRFNNNNRNEAIPSSVELQEKASKLAIDSPIRSSVQLHTSGSHTAGGFDMEDLVSKIILGLKNSVANGGNHDDKWTLEQIGNSLIDLTDSMEMRTSKIAKMVNQIVASSSSSSSSVQEVSTVNNSALPSGLVQDEILHICKAIESRMNQSNSSVSSEVYCSSSPSFLQASIDSISNDIKLGLNKLHENLDSLDQSQDTKLIEIKTAIMSHLDSFSANQAISAASAATLESNGKRTELLLVSKLDEIQKTVVSALEHVSNTDDEESSGTVINAKLDNINEVNRDRKVGGMMM